jgi:hypothetical protein
VYDEGAEEDNNPNLTGGVALVDVEAYEAFEQSDSNVAARW